MKALTLAIGQHKDNCAGLPKMLHAKPALYSYSPDITTTSRLWHQRSTSSTLLLTLSCWMVPLSPAVFAAVWTWRLCEGC
eukprot:1968843-Pleurochrysis_carterae.AAC.1